MSQNFNAIVDGHGDVIISTKELQLTDAYLTISQSGSDGKKTSHMAIVRAYDTLKPHPALLTLANEARVITDIIDRNKIDSSMEKLSTVQHQALQRRLDLLDSNAYKYVSQFTPKLEINER
jgi:hypothetical protein